MSGIAAKTAFCLSLGCFKNQVDGERMCGTLRDAGYRPVENPEGAEVCLLNTCGFLRSAVEENLAAIFDLAELKAQGKTARIGVAGCLVNRYGAALAADIPEVDFWGRCEDYDAIRAWLDPDRFDCSGRRGLPARSPLPGRSAHVRYLKLSEGCDNRCSYCAIPNIRGNLRSLPIDLLVREAEALVAEGARELCLVGQDLTVYGSDLGGGDDLYALLDALEGALPRDLWMRLLYLQPARVDRRLLERVANGVQILPYLDIPIQHASPAVLRAMNRGDDPERLLGLFETARRIRPDFALRTTCMVGFPGETRADFAALLRFLSDAQFDRAGCFLYSPEEGTPAADMAGQVAVRTKRARLERLMALQEEISLARQSLFLGETLDVLIDSLPGGGIAEGRSFREAPEVDGVIEIRGAGADLAVGETVRATITDAYEHDMVAKLAGEVRS